VDQDGNRRTLCCFITCDDNLLKRRRRIGFTIAATSPVESPNTLGETNTMIATAKLDNIDHRQTVRLPPGFELAGDEVWVRKDDATGEVTLSPKPPSPDQDRLSVLFAMLDEAPLPEDFLADRPNAVEIPRNPLEDWTE
jgi:antitoxin VapB